MRASHSGPALHTDHAKSTPVIQTDWVGSGDGLLISVSWGWCSLWPVKLPLETSFPGFSDFGIAFEMTYTWKRVQQDVDRMFAVLSYTIGLTNLLLTGLLPVVYYLSTMVQKFGTHLPSTAHCSLLQSAHKHCSSWLSSLRVKLVMTHAQQTQRSDHPGFGCPDLGGWLWKRTTQGRKNLSTVAQGVNLLPLSRWSSKCLLSPSWVMLNVFG